MCDTSISEVNDEIFIGKRRANPSGYKRNIIKKARLMGKEHTNHTGKVITSKSIGNDCR